MQLIARGGDMPPTLIEKKTQTVFNLDKLIKVNS